MSIAVWVLFGRSEDLTVDGLVQERSITTPEAMPSDDLPVANLATVLREETQLTPAKLYPQWTTPPDRQNELHGLVLGPNEQPFAGAAVVIMRPAKQGSQTLDLTRNAHSEEVDSTISNQDGEFRISLGPGSQYDLDVSAEGFCAPLVKGCQAGERVVVRLEPSASVSGVVTAQLTGDPVENIPVRLFRPGGKGRRIQTKTDAQGYYQITGLTAGDWYLELSPPKLQQPDWASLKIEYGQNSVMDFSLLVGDIVRGRVIDAITKQPIFGAEVSHSWVFRRNFLTDAEGRFELTGLRAIFGEIKLHARAGGYGRLNQTTTNGAKNEERLIELLPAQTVIGTVLFGNGNPASGAYVAAVASDYIRGTQQVDWQSTLSGAEGHFEIHDVRPDLQHTLQVQKQGSGSLIYEFPDPIKGQMKVDLGVIYLPPAAWISGRVHDEAGVGVPGLEMDLTGWNEDRGKFGRPVDDGVDSYLMPTKSRTDDLGRFRFPDLAQGSYTLEISRAGKQQIEPMLIGVATGKGSEGLEIMIPNGEVIAGVVLGPDGSPFPGARVNLKADEMSDGGYTSIETDKNGHFQFDGVTSGTYRVKASPPYPLPSSSAFEVLYATTKQNVSPGQTELSIKLRRGSAITGNVLDSEGSPLHMARVRATDSNGRHVASERTAKDGSFELQLADGEMVNIEVRPPFRIREDGRSFRIPELDSVRFNQEGVLAGTAGLICKLQWRLDS
jgi:large repetitive protein